MNGFRYPLSLDEFKIFYGIDRALYVILVKDLWRNPSECLQIMGFWLWLERTGSCNVVNTILSLPTILVNELADEAIACLRCINDRLPLSPEAAEIPLTLTLVKKNLPRHIFRKKLLTAYDEVQSLISEICIPALSDIMERARHGLSVDSMTQNSIPSQTASSSLTNQIRMSSPPENPFRRSFSNLNIRGDNSMQSFSNLNIGGDNPFMQSFSNLNTEGDDPFMRSFSSLKIRGENSMKSSSNLNIGGDNPFKQSFSNLNPEGDDPFMRSFSSLKIRGDNSMKSSSNLNSGGDNPFKQSFSNLNTEGDDPFMRSFSSLKIRGDNSMKSFSKLNIGGDNPFMQSFSNLNIEGDDPFMQSFSSLKIGGDNSMQRYSNLNIGGDDPFMQSFSNLNVERDDPFMQRSFSSLKLGGDNSLQSFSNLNIGGDKPFLHSFSNLNTEGDNSFMQSFSSLNMRDDASTSRARPRTDDVSRYDRTMFVTFSKGYPVTENEVRLFFTRLYGNCIEAVHMQEVSVDEQALYARIVFIRPSFIDMILKGVNKAKFTINGKHVWMRKFVPKSVSVLPCGCPSIGPSTCPHQ